MKPAAVLLIVLAAAAPGLGSPNVSQGRGTGNAEPGTGSSETSAPWFGTWEQDLPKTVPWYESPPYKRVTLRIEPRNDGLRVIYDMVRTRGGVTHVEWDGRFDGQDYPVQGMDYPMTNAYRLVDGRTYQIVVKVDGRPAATAVAVVSPDGQRLTVTTTQDAAGGQPGTAVYRRTG